jgi:D-alanyl-D-alanine carboxypeptidase/D-alanyl-D-alanine-endopeptidase (penicillin-binding protein 4)
MRNKKVYPASTGTVPPFLFLIFYFSFLIFLSSCSVQKQIAKSARENVLNASALQTAHVGISIYEPATNKYWFNYQGDHYFVPASNTKIPTCYAAMKYLGDSLTGIMYDDSENKLKLIGAADPTFLHPDFSKQPVFDFIKKSSFTDISLFELVPPMSNQGFKFFGSGWSWNDYNENYMAERNFFPIYGNIARFKLKGNKVEVIPSYFQPKVFQSDSSLISFDIERLEWTNGFFVSAGSKKYQEIPIHQGADFPIISVEDDLLCDTIHRKIGYGKIQFPSAPHLKRIHSQPTDSLLKPMMHRSDNFFAEQTLLMISNERLGFMNDEKIIDTLLKTDFKDLPQKPRWVDGSGLSRYNLFTPQDLVTILTKMKNEFGMDRIKVILPTGGEGTFSNYYKSESGFLYAKTGTLSGVVSISGFLYTKKNKLLAFSILVNNHNASATDVRRAVEKFVQGVRNKY